jgi:mannose-1-phosphate guanylyltransferase
MSDGNAKLWAIVLAGGQGTRLASLTRALYGTDLPKQYAVLAGSRSLLQATVDRILPLVPAERIVIVVGREHEALARDQLREWPGAELVVQPRNLDTGPGLILPLARIRSRDRSARVAVLPADHYISDQDAFLHAVDLGVLSCRMDAAAISLLGAEPDAPDTEYGWIVAGRRLGTFGLRRVQRFVEKPALPLAEWLFRQGALWNTFVMVGAVEALWRLSSSHLPRHAARMEACRRAVDLEEAYASLPAANFSRAVLERADHLAVISLRAGWSDWGTPRRVFQSLAGTADHDRLLARIAAPVDRMAAMA